MRAPRTLVVDPRLGPVVPASAVRAVAAAAQVRLDPSVPAPLAAAFARDLGAVPPDAPAPPDPDADVVVLSAAGPSAVPSPPGTALLDAVAVMDRLRSPGGCPWDAAQSHASLLRYLVEETYELYDALADGDRAAVREELGDVLLQVLFHARLAAEDPAEGFGIDEVAATLVDKLVGRHPHVFAGAEEVVTASDQQVRWEELKTVEKGRSSALDGVAGAQPAAALAAKFVSRARRAGVPADLLARAPGDGVGAELYALVAAAQTGVTGADGTDGTDGDPEGDLRAAAEDLGRRVRAAEDSARAAGQDPAALDATGWRRHWPAG